MSEWTQFSERPPVQSDLPIAVVSIQRDVVSLYQTALPGEHQKWDAWRSIGPLPPVAKSAEDQAFEAAWQLYDVGHNKDGARLLWDAGRDFERQKGEPTEEEQVRAFTKWCVDREEHQPNFSRCYAHSGWQACYAWMKGRK